MNRHDLQTSVSKKQGVRTAFKKAKPPAVCIKCERRETLGAPRLDSVDGGVLDPARQIVVVRIAPYARMACGDRLILSWTGLDAEGAAYRHEVIRFVSNAQLGKDVVCVIRSAHISALDGGLLQVFWTLTRAGSSRSVTSARLQLDVGDVRYSLLPAIIDDSIGGHLDPVRVTHGTTVTIGPYAWMAAGDRVSLIWQGASVQTTFHDQLLVESFAVGDSLVFGIAPEVIAAHVDSQVTVRYRIERQNGVIRESGATRVIIAPLTRVALSAPKIIEAIAGVLDLQNADGDVCVIVDDAQLAAGELIYLKCDGENFSHREDRDISDASELQPQVFSVPQEFWLAHVGTEVRISYSVERLDDVSQLSEVTLLRVQA